MTEEQAAQTITKDIVRGNLRIARLYDGAWVVIAIRDDQPPTVLCQGIRDYDIMVFHPIRWKTYQGAETWVLNGCIGQLQEEMSDLAVGFQTEQAKMIRAYAY
jgi:hypothetical protein